ncbi:unnamed protein product, partial [Adineta steineri]
MKFISFIASTMLIALISQQSTMGLPLNTTVEEETCSKGFELIDGHCKPIKSELHENIESASIPVEIAPVMSEKVVLKTSTPELVGACPNGMEHDEHGMCQEIKSKLHETNVESTSMPVEITTILDETVYKKDTPRRDGGCPDGWEHGEHGICQEIKSKSHEENVESTSTPFDIPTIRYNNVVAKEDKPELSGACPEGMEHGEHGICQEIKSKLHETNVESTSIPFDVPTIVHEKLVLNEVTPQKFGACPEGMKHGEHGICQEIKSYDMIESTTELTDDAAKLSDHTVRQKDDIVTPKGKIVKPKKDIVEPKDDIVKPKEDIVKPKKDSVKVTDDSLEKKDDVKPKEDIVEPKEDVVEPKEHIVNPKDKLFKPTKNSIKVTDDTLEKKDDVKPKEDIVEPKDDIVTPKDDIVTPKDDIVTPKGKIVKPKEDIVEPRGKFVKPRKNIVEPKEDIVEPKEDIVKPKKDVDEPKEDIVEPKEDVVEPKEHVVNPKDKLVKPNKNSIKVTDDNLEKTDDVKPKEDVDESKEDTDKPKHDVVTKPTKYEIPRGCPEGTQPDERGYCLEIKPSRLTKDIFNPKMLLAKDGSCPRNYVMIKEL